VFLDPRQKQAAAEQKVQARPSGRRRKNVLEQRCSPRRRRTGFALALFLA
jgi:hypothetical protein